MTLKTRHFIDIVIVLLQKDLKVRYKNSILGYLWSVAHPLAFAVVFYVAFKVIVKIPVENYALFLICGLFPWQWFANSVNAAPMIFLGNAPADQESEFSEESYSIYPCPAGHDAFCSRRSCDYFFSFFRRQNTGSAVGCWYSSPNCGPTFSCVWNLSDDCVFESFFQGFGTAHHDIYDDIILCDTYFLS